MPLSFPRGVDDPREMPELRAALVELARDGGEWERTEVNRCVVDVGGPSTRLVNDEPDARVFYSDEGFSPDELHTAMELAVQRGRNSTRWYRESLAEAQLIYVTPEMCDLVRASAEAVPDDLVIHAEDAPAICGLVVLGQPLWGTDVANGLPIRVDALSWGPVMLPPRHERWELWDKGDVTPGVAVAAYRLLLPGHDDEMALTMIGGLAAEFGRKAATLPQMWLPLGRTDWPWGDPLNLPPRDAVPSDSIAWASMREDRSYIAALWAVLNQRRLVSYEPVDPARPVRRRLERAGVTGRNETVQVVHLRRTEYVPKTEREEGGRHVSVRFLVRPHFRRQPYGPGRKQRRLTLIPGHIKGPVDAPLTHSERVWQLDR